MARPADPERAAARRAAITDAAGHLFAERGFENTTAAEIARRAGLSAGSVFYYFTDKRALFRAIFERDIPASRELIDRLLAEPDPLPAILALVDALAAEAGEPYAIGIMVELIRQVDRDPELEKVVDETSAIVQDGLITLIERGIRNGDIDGELDPGEAATWVQTVIDAAYLNANPGRDSRPMLRRIVSRFLATPTSGVTR
ncbi:TetR family transcriptional regulator [Tamaricihabitans halophyticus]|uniref:TetR family transcriptional regulator n=1 Tax=Tamaricihabitans halophyticus TaxID=1262583 RepID=A0A4R2Q5D1_9PSEU|nr:TetR/AcrR family transcriptional regulator [Tamaricihabitans halophyticus]TCP43860.1 TetR family transcriptional regulator [Tamaricihabitans halophyticus]